MLTALALALARVRPFLAPQAKLRGVHAHAVAQRDGAQAAQRARLAALRQQAVAAEAELRGVEGSDDALDALVAPGDLRDLEVRTAGQTGSSHPTPLPHSLAAIFPYCPFLSLLALFSCPPSACLPPPTLPL